MALVPARADLDALTQLTRVADEAEGLSLVRLLESRDA